nr:phospholipase A2 inhibitor and Ly6/PLAUR domain-containing protein-like [Caretta caretta]
MEPDSSSLFCSLKQTPGHNVTVWANIACWLTDGCKAGAIPVPTVSSVPNGRQCLSFFKMGADGWQEKEKELLACTGAEDHCVEESGILTLGGITAMKAVAGCGSPGACMKRVGERKYIQGVVEWQIQSECYPAPRAGGGIGEPRALAWRPPLLLIQDKLMYPLEDLCVPLEYTDPWLRTTDLH